jgi:hypothetical protein
VLLSLHSLLLWSLPLMSTVRGDYQFHLIEEAIDANHTISDFFWSNSDASENATVQVPFTLEEKEAIPIDGFTKIIDIDVDGEKWTVRIHSVVLERRY